VRDRLDGIGRATSSRPRRVGWAGRGHRAARAAAIAAALLLSSAVPSSVPVAQAAGDGWQNANGTSKTATGQAGAGGQPAQVFAFDTGQTVTACSSPQGTCVIGQPDGPTWFEVFATSPATSITFSVTTAAPIACGYKLTFKASFNGSTYTDEPSLPSNNPDCPPPPEEHKPCPISGVSGSFEPAQAVWQDDPLDAAHHFADKPGKQLTQISPTSYEAELPMVRNKPTLLFGIDHDQLHAPRDRDTIVIEGTTTGTTAVPVGMLFSGTGAGVTLLHETGVLTSIDLDAPCGPAQTWSHWARRTPCPSTPPGT